MTAIRRQDKQPQALHLHRPGRASGTDWRLALETLDFALQPIVNIHTGMCEGCEALLRHHQEAGFTSIQAVFNQAQADHILAEVELALRAKAIHKFMEIPFHHRLKLFYNIDNRLLSSSNADSHLGLADFVQRFGLYPGSFVYEISERHEGNMDILNDFHGLEEIKGVLKSFRREMFKFAIDDFGTGLSGLQLLYHCEPDYMKIDRFFIDGLAASRRKKLFVASTVKMARTLGNSVIAEGLENNEDFYACDQVGCDYVQGYLIQRPTLNAGEIRQTYEMVTELRRRDRRDPGHDQHLIRDQIEKMRAIPLYGRKGELTSMDTVFEVFRQEKNNSLFPVVDHNHEPVGVIREKDLKEYVYSPFGKDILRNRAAPACHFTQFISRMPVTEIRTRVENILEIFALNPEAEGTLVTDNGRYQGFLSANALLKLLSEKNLKEARDQNPLTRLPGNYLISRFISEGLRDQDNEYAYAYFDFDNFKPFNDKYGLRNGDRAIMMFADILRETGNTGRCFIGHVGGDDFFAGFKLEAWERELGASQVEEIVRRICRRFASDATSIYNHADRKNGFITAPDREGNPKKFPLLTVSAALLHLPANDRAYALEEVFTMLAELKKQAKHAPDKFAAHRPARAAAAA